jgi:hypothetical protein
VELRLLKAVAARFCIMLLFGQTAFADERKSVTFALPHRFFSTGLIGSSAQTRFLNFWI